MSSVEKLSEIIKHKAKLSHVCEGKVYYRIDTTIHNYMLEIDSLDDMWKATYLFPEFKGVELMRWIREGIEDKRTFIMLK